MSDFDQYKQRLEALGAAYTGFYDEITADGMVDYGEAARGKEFIAKLRPELQKIKEELNAAMKEERSKWREEILLAKRRNSGRTQAEVVEELNLKQHYAIHPYQISIAFVDKLLLGTASTKELFQDTMDTMMKEGSSQIDVTPSAQDEDEEAEMVEDPPLNCGNY